MTLPTFFLFFFFAPFFHDCGRHRPVHWSLPSRMILPNVLLLFLFSLWTTQTCSLEPCVGLPRQDDSCNCFTVCVLGCVFRTVDDIDLFTGAMCEPPMVGGVVGPTLACLIGRQFADLKAGDRFFYQTTGPEGFTPGEPSVVEGGARRGGSCAGGGGGGRGGGWAVGLWGL